MDAPLLRILLAGTAVVLCGGIASCTPAGRSLTAAVKGAPQCNRYPAHFYQLRAEITRYLTTCLGQAACAGEYHSVQTKVLAGYSAGPWLWQGANANTFSAAEQDGFIAAARTQAQAQKPSAATIVDIEIFTDIVPYATGTGHYVGARATYAVCGPRSAPHQ
ncbi:MAG TPA: hypothetical protein VN231_06240 [Allosphingosinicella sp.]|nr:hypothetical protein [Allosphingosinicella sp.]